jgi:hypothetical protein
MDGTASVASPDLRIDLQSRPGDAKRGLDRSDLARLASVLVSPPWSETSAPSAGPTDRTNDSTTGPVIGNDADGVTAGVQALGSPRADRLSHFSRAGEGLAGLFDASPIATLAPFAGRLDPGRSPVPLAAGPLGDLNSAEEMRLGFAYRPGGSTGASETADAETIVELASRLVLAAERLEQAAGRLGSRGPYPLTSAPRPFLGRIEA